MRRRRGCYVRARAATAFTAATGACDIASVISYESKAACVFARFSLCPRDLIPLLLLDYKELGPPCWGRNKYPESGFVKPPRSDTRALSPAGLFGGKAPHRLVAQKSRPCAPLASMNSAPADFICKWGV
jgi:hypothetical protein